MSDLPNYLTVNQLISLAKAQGVTFGSAAPKVHLAFLSKLGLIPGAVKRKYNSEVVGHYPAETLTTLSEIQKMKEKGISYSDMKFFNKSNIPNPPISNQPILNFQFSITLSLFLFSPWEFSLDIFWVWENQIRILKTCHFLPITNLFTL